MQTLLEVVVHSTDYYERKDTMEQKKTLSDKTLIEYFKELSENVFPLLTLLVPILTTISYTANYFYSRDMELFYGIPKKYLSTTILDVVDHVALMLFAVVFAFIIIIFPFFIRKNYFLNNFIVKKSISPYFVYYIFSLLLGFISSYFFNVAIAKYYSTNILILLLFWLIPFIIYFYLFSTDFGREGNKTISMLWREIRRDFHSLNLSLQRYLMILFSIITITLFFALCYYFNILTIIYKKREGAAEFYQISLILGAVILATIIVVVGLHKFIKKYSKYYPCSLFLYMYLLLSILLIIAIAGLFYSNKTSFFPKDKKSYEIVTLEHRKWAAVITIHDDKMILMNCDIDSTKNTLILYKGRYFFEDKEKYSFKYHTFDNVKCIDSNYLWSSIQTKTELQISKKFFICSFPPFFCKNDYSCIGCRRHCKKYFL